MCSFSSNKGWRRRLLGDLFATSMSGLTMWEKIRRQRKAYRTLPLEYWYCRIHSFFQWWDCYLHCICIGLFLVYLACYLIVSRSRIAYNTTLIIRLQFIHCTQAILLRVLGWMLFQRWLTNGESFPPNHNHISSFIATQNVPRKASS
jgi:hypothetical protein